jgi:WD40 repeat protein
VAAGNRLNPDAIYVLLGFNNGTDGMVRLADLATGGLVWESGNTQNRLATRAEFSPDGKSVLVGYMVGAEQGVAATGAAQRFDTASGKALGEPLAHPQPVYAAAFHPGGRSFVTGCGRWGNGTDRVDIRFWDLEGRQTREPLGQPCPALAVAYSPDGTRLLTGNWDHALLNPSGGS